MMIGVGGKGWEGGGEQSWDGKVTHSFFSNLITVFNIIDMV
jgi:hypothetical protein